MRTVPRLLLVVALLLVLAGDSAGDARADDAGGADGSAGGYIDDTGDPTAEAGEGGSSSDPPTPTAPPAVVCTWEVINEDDTKVPMYDVNGNEIHSATGRWFQKICDGRAVEVNGSFAIPEQEPVDPAVLAQKARQSVSIPEPVMVTSPSADRRLYTRVTTWLWVDPGWWQGYSATAAVGGVSSTVVATPLRAVWTMGDGSQVTCTGPGTEWQPGMVDAQSTCLYVYRNASAGQVGGRFTLTVEVEFEVSWSSNIGPGGSLAQITRSASRAVEVGEIQAVGTQ